MTARSLLRSVSFASGVVYPASRPRLSVTLVLPVRPELLLSLERRPLVRRPQVLGGIHQPQGVLSLAPHDPRRPRQPHPRARHRTWCSASPTAPPERRPIPPDQDHLLQDRQPQALRLLADVTRH
jgi:hypothetical protein